MAAKKIFEFSLLRRVLQYAAPYKNRFYISVALSIILAIFSPVRPYLIQLTINNYIKNGVEGTGAIKIKMEEMIIWITII
ncbi:MAG: ABC transporter ATP-binding protein, partial [Flavitalea sp.]